MADINSCISMIQQAEEELRKAVADLIVSSYKHGNTQNEAERYLDLCNRLFDISEELKKPLQRQGNTLPMSQMRTLNTLYASLMEDRSTKSAFLSIKTKTASNADGGKKYPTMKPKR